MEQIGYSLIDADGNEVSHWGDGLGVCVGKPDKIVLPNGDHVHCPALGDLQSWRLVPRMAERGTPAGISFDGTNIVVKIAATVADVVIERERRLAGGFHYDFGNGRGVHLIQTTAADMVGWDEVSKLASALIAGGLGGTQINILTGTGAATVTALEWQSVLIAAAQFRQPLWAASFVLQATNPIPADYADDTYWS